MGLIFDTHSARQYESWHASPKGKALDRFVENHIPTLLDPNPGEKVLDIGCGSGNHLQMLHHLGLDITGVDASPYMISKAREHLGDRGTLKTGVAEDLPFEDNEFDVAVFINTLEFLDDPVQALREAGRVAKKKVFICVLNNFSWYRLVDKLQSVLGVSLLGPTRFYNLWEIKSYVRAVFGQVPLVWKSAPILYPIFDKVGALLPDFCRKTHCPFGPFIGISLTIAYRIKTDNLPLKLRVRKASQPIAGEVTSLGGLKRDNHS